MITLFGCIKLALLCTAIYLIGRGVHELLQAAAHRVLDWFVKRKETKP